MAVKARAEGGVAPNGEPSAEPCDFENMGFFGHECGIHIINSAWVRLRNTGAKASAYTGGDSNAAMVLENSFWQW